jgi:NadR type nicotinamide-nucleotide adenylyltransferase
LKKVVIIGPESTGKSTLCKQLSQHFNCDHLPEYARLYLEENGSEYTYEDVLLMARGQLASELSFNPKTPFHFIDTNIMVFKVWIEEKYKLKVDWIEEEIEKDNCDFYLLCSVDLPWEEDPLREYPDQKDRERLFSRFYELVVKTKKPFAILKGVESERLKEALSSLNKIQ